MRKTIRVCLVMMLAGILIFLALRSVGITGKTVSAPPYTEKVEGLDGTPAR